jgi:predicted ester cyclase
MSDSLATGRCRRIIVACMSEDDVVCEAVVRQLYAAFNARRLDEAAGLFHEEAVLEHIPLGRQQRGPEGYREFAAMWLNAFPDATVDVERVNFRGGRRCEVDLRVNGTHRGALDLGGYGHFKPSGAAGEIRMRQMVEMTDGRIAFSSLSFDVQAIVQQLVSVDVPALLKRLEKLRDLEARLTAVPAHDIPTRRAVLDRLGVELDAARRIVRPYFDR